MSGFTDLHRLICVLVTYCIDDEDTTQIAHCTFVPVQEAVLGRTSTHSLMPGSDITMFTKLCKSCGNGFPVQLLICSKVYAMKMSAYVNFFPTR